MKMNSTAAGRLWSSLGRCCSREDRKRHAFSAPCFWSSSSA